MPKSAAVVASAGPTTGRAGGSYERVTVNLTEKTSMALSEVVRMTRDSKTDAINKALQLYAFLQQIAENDGGGVYIREKAGAELERLRVL